MWEDRRSSGVVRIGVRLVVLLGKQKIIVLDPSVLPTKIVELNLTNGADFFLELAESFFDRGIKRKGLDSSGSDRSKLFAFGIFCGADCLLILLRTLVA